MTAGHPAPPTAPAHPTAPGSAQESAPRHTSHRMLKPATLQERLREWPAVIEWIFAVRAELERKYGEVGPLSQFADDVKATRPASTRSRKQMRASFSEQLRTKPGPSSKFAADVLNIVVEPDRRAEVTARFAALYEAARGERAPFAPPAPVLSKPGQLPTVVPVPLATTPETELIIEAQLEAAQAQMEILDSTGELRELVAELQAKIEESEQREAAMRVELAALTHEANQLKKNLAAVNLVKGLRPAPGHATACAEQVAQAPAIGRHVPQPRSAARNDTLSSLNRSADSRRIDRWMDADLPIEDYWLGDLWEDLRGDKLEDGDVASRFGEIARELASAGVGAKIRVPRHWTSQGPSWFYGALCTIFALGMIMAVALPKMAAPPARQAENDNVLVDMLNGKYPAKIGPVRP